MPRLHPIDPSLAVAQTNGCDYCLSAHTAIGGLYRIPADRKEHSS